jgi:hypothetical protein
LQQAALRLLFLVRCSHGLSAKVPLDRRIKKLAETFLQGVVRLLLDSVSTGSVNWAQQAIGGKFLVEFSKGE